MRSPSALARASAGRKTYPDEKGIETYIRGLGDLNHSLGRKTYPDEKGIETLLYPKPLEPSFFCRKTYPDEKGIETDSSAII